MKVKRIYSVDVGTFKVRDVLPVMMRNIELMEREIADFKKIVKAMMGDGDMYVSDDFFLRR